MEFLWYSVGMSVLLSWGSFGTQLGFLSDLFGIPVVLRGDILWYSFSLYVCIFWASLNNLFRFVTSHTDAQMAKFCAPFGEYKKKPILILINGLLIESIFFEIMKILLQKYNLLSSVVCLVFGSQRISSTE